jgi:hypothetical protein
MRRAASVLHSLLIFSIAANAAAPGGFFYNGGSSSAESSFDQWLLSQYHYSLNPDGTIFAPHNDTPLPRTELPQILRHLKSSQRLKVLFQLDLIFNEDPSGDSLTDDEKRHVRRLLRENWPIFTEGLRLEFKHYFSKEEYRTLNAQSPPAVPDERTALLADPQAPPSPKQTPHSPTPPASHAKTAAQGSFSPPSLFGATPPAEPPAPKPAPASSAAAKPNAILQALQETQKDISMLLSLQTMALLNSLRGQPAPTAPNVTSGGSQAASAVTNDYQKTLLALLEQQSSLLGRTSASGWPALPAVSQAGNAAPGAAPSSPALSYATAPLAALSEPPIDATLAVPQPAFDASSPHTSQVILPPFLASVAWSHRPPSPDAGVAPGEGVLKAAPGASPFSVLLAAPESKPPLLALAPQPAPAPPVLPAAAAPRAPIPLPVSTPAVVKTAPAVAVSSSDARAPATPPQNDSAVLSELSKLQAKAHLQILMHTQLDDFLAQAPYEDDVKGYIRMIAKAAPDFAKNRALDEIISRLPQIRFDPNLLGGGFSGRVMPAAPGADDLPTIAVPKSLALYEKRRWLFDTTAILLPDSLDYYSKRGLDFPRLLALRDNLSHVEENSTAWGQTRIYTDGSRRVMFSKEELAGFLLYDLLILRAREKGWYANRYGTELFARTAQMMFYAKVSQEKSPEDFLDLATRGLFDEWLRQPSQWRDLLAHSLSSDVVGYLRQQGLTSAGAAATCPSNTGRPVEALRKEIDAFNGLGVFKNRELDAARASLASKEDPEPSMADAPPATDRKACAAWKTRGAKASDLLVEMEKAEVAFRKELIKLANQ